MTVTKAADLSFTSRILGMLYGVAFGDALGGPVEKLSARQIAEKYGRVTSIHQRWHRTSRPHGATTAYAATVSSPTIR